MIKATVVADSICNGHRITTMEVTMPRFILAELNTHRMFSRNSASSRAIPFKKMVAAVKENPFIPIAWQIDHSGMQGTEYITNPIGIEIRIKQWLNARDKACSSAWELHNSWETQDEGSQTDGVTKQLCNRLLEPFMWQTVLITATEWENFFALRCPQYVLPLAASVDMRFRSWKDVVKHAGTLSNSDSEQTMKFVEEFSTLRRLQQNKGGAEIHMMATAEAMWDAMNESIPQQLKEGEWHIPYGDNITDEQIREFMLLRGEERFGAAGKELTKAINDFVEVNKIDRKIYSESILVPVSTARCAQVSYTVIDTEGKPMDLVKLLKLCEKLAGSDHWSPFEHCARAMNGSEYERYVAGPGKQRGWCGNFRGWMQYRKLFKNENITK